METNKKIDYGTLEWFDSEKNFPPMRVDLYVDSEHGYGIGRLGRRVKDKSIIWTVNLESGEVYLVYAFYKVKRWAYIPKDEKTNTKLKYELKAVHAFDVYEAYTKTGDDDAVQVYLKSEADKFIADLEESHKMEVEQLLIEIAELKEKLNNSRNARKYWRKEYLIEYKESIHHKYKRCLANARIAQDDWHLHNSFYAMGHQEFEKRKCDFYEKWHRRWLAIAEKFKPNPTINKKGGTNALQR